jgi:hypothetical protein
MFILFTSTVLTRGPRIATIGLRIVETIWRADSSRINRRCVLALVLIGGFVALTPLVYASPADPGWVAGIWDAADYDDMLSLIDSIDRLARHGAAIDAGPEWNVNRPLHTVGMAPLPFSMVPKNVSLVACPTRGPPLDLRERGPSVPAFFLLVFSPIMSLTLMGGGRRQSVGLSSDEKTPQGIFDSRPNSPSRLQSQSERRRGGRLVCPPRDALTSTKSGRHTADSQCDVDDGSRAVLLPGRAAAEHQSGIERVTPVTPPAPSVRLHAQRACRGPPTGSCILSKNDGRSTATTPKTREVPP